MSSNSEKDTIKSNKLQSVARKRASASGKLFVPTNTFLRDSLTFASQAKTLQVDLSSALNYNYPTNVPEQFDGKTVWKHFLPPVKNQCECGACWAFATTACLAARINIWTNNGIHVDLSPAKLVSCNWGGETEYKLVEEGFRKQLDFRNLAGNIANALSAVGCSGETLIGAWQYLYRYGAVTEACHPYDDPKFNLCTVHVGDTVPSCEAISGKTLDLCSDGTAERQYRAGGYYYVGAADPADAVAAIQAEIWKYGPVTSGMVVYDDLFGWDGKGVYEWDGIAPQTGGHAILIVGWGVDAATKKPYWQVQNTWGAEWGNDGYFRILRGVNHCDIESNVVTGYPDMPLADRFLLNKRLSTTQDLFLRNVWEQDPSGYNEDRIDEMLEGLADKKLLTYVYPSRLVPDYTTMLAGQPSQIRYPYATLSIQYGLLYVLLVLGLAALLAVAYLVFMHVTR
jgi:cathepsin B